MRLGIIGYGSIGQALARHLLRERATDITVLVRRAQDDVDNLRFVSRLEDLLAFKPSLVVECAGHDAARACLIPLLEAGVSVLPASLGVFADAAFLAKVRRAAQPAGRAIIFPSGAIGGLDLLRALSAKGNVKVAYQGIKPPAAWKGSPAERLVDLDALDTRHVFFSGHAREAAQTFPKNANVVAALALAGPGFDGVTVDLVADPAASGNTHVYDVTAPACSYRMAIKGAASAGNARTSETTILSLLAEVRAFAARQVGT